PHWALQLMVGYLSACRFQWQELPRGVISRSSLREQVVSCRSSRKAFECCQFAARLLMTWLPLRQEHFASRRTGCRSVATAKGEAPRTSSSTETTSLDRPWHRW